MTAPFDVTLHTINTELAALSQFLPGWAEARLNDIIARHALALVDARRCRRALDELVQNALRDEIEHQACIAAQKPTARILPFAPRTPCARPPSPGAA
jgi:hypothetical protein